MTLSRICILSLVASIVACGPNATHNEATSFDAASLEAAPIQIPEEIKTNCYICHNPDSPSHDAIIAPPLAVVKMRYNRQHQDRKSFVDAMTSFLLNPTKEKAIMYGAVSRFGIMPVTVFDEPATRRIVEYIYSNKLEEPSWLQEEMKKSGMNP